MELFDYYKINLESKNVLVIGRNKRVGIPIMMECLKRNASVSICHSKTNNLKSLDVDDFKNIAGIGLSGTINDKSYLIGNNKLFDKYKINNNMLREEKKLSLDGNSIVF